MNFMLRTNGSATPIPLIGRSWNGYSADFGNHFSYDTHARFGSKDGMLYNGNIGIGPYSVIILSQDNMQYM